MIAVDTSFLIDYLDGVETTREFLEDHRNTPFFAPSLVLFEVYRGGGRTGGRQGSNGWRRRSTGSTPSR